MILTMLCWGSWANTLKLCPGYRFQLFYWDYAIGLAAGAILWGLTAGSMGHAGLPFLSDAAQTPLASILFAVCGGVIFNIANLLLVAAIEVAGLAVAFPVGIGLALVVGAVSSYLVRPAGNPLLLFGGVALVAVAIVLDAAAYRKRESSAKAATTRGIVLSLVAGVLMGTFYPLVARALGGVPGKPAPGPYAVAFFFAVGVLLSTVPANLAADGQAAGRQATRGRSRLPERADELAHCGFAGWGDLVHGRSGQLCGLGRSPGGTGCFLLHRAGRDHDLRLLGSFCVARVCHRSPLSQNPVAFYVHLLRTGARCGCAGSAAPV